VTVPEVGFTEVVIRLSKVLILRGSRLELLRRFLEITRAAIGQPEFVQGESPFRLLLNDLGQHVDRRLVFAEIGQRHPEVKHWAGNKVRVAVCDLLKSDLCLLEL